AEPASADTDTTVRLQLADGGGAPVAGAPVTLERSTGDGWSPVATVTTSPDGTASQPVRLSRVPADNVVRATYAGDETHDAAARQVQVELTRRSSRVTLGGPDTVVDGRSVAITVRWTTGAGAPVPGRVKIYRSLDGARWRLARTVTTGDDGRGRLTTTPRVDSRWRARAVRQPWVEGDRSPAHRVDNLPPGKPVRLPKAAPRPRHHLPSQPRATGAGANVVITPIPARVWRQMTGASWHRGCPVGRSALRLVRVNYWDYGGYPRRGELVTVGSAAPAMGAAFAEMFRRELPVRAMYRVDRFGWGKRSRGGNDYASMAAGNTSAFNCRDVTGRPGVRSPHSYGRSLDVNTWENPYRSARGTVPNTWWQSQSHPRVAWRSRSHPVVALMARHGFRWTYGLGDTQHFDYVGSRARAAVAPRPCDRLCDAQPTGPTAPEPATDPAPSD
ncbi:M15 family metallopeptidase, partial [Nocardioides sp.]|uniref:M15 family metallopeptidase n=1 Tax=Nocardioides sp. TaxID=35761 RepID=UPI0025D8D651